MNNLSFKNTEIKRLTTHYSRLPTQNQKMKTNLVIIPTYNEIENIEAIIRKVFSLSENFDLLIVDDGSPDGTGQKVKDLRSEERRVGKEC